MRVTLPLVREAGAYPDNQTIVDRLKVLGFEIQRARRASANPDEVEVQIDGATVKVQINTPDYYRELARKNLDAELPEGVQKEIARYSVYFGALSATKTYVAFVRTVESELTVLVVQEKFDLMLRVCEEVFERIHKQRREVKLFDRSIFTGVCTTELSSVQASKVVTTGLLIDERFARFAAERRVELVGLAFTIFLAFVCFAVDLTPAGNGDPLPLFVRTFVSKSWPSLVISAMLLSVTLLISFLRMERKRIRWKWA
jgi:hypothetical protein